MYNPIGIPWDDPSGSGRTMPAINLPPISANGEDMLSLFRIPLLDTIPEKLLYEKKHSAKTANQDW